MLECVYTAFKMKGLRTSVYMKRRAEDMGSHMWHGLRRTIQATSHNSTMPQPIVPDRHKLTSQDNKYVTHSWPSVSSDMNAIEHVQTFLAVTSKT
ncbi:hypothetical protein PoB_007133100 [Plakobranchus ocellatus]|uniref:Uncharacterized protein n=1 Tax=Plakobranchus ocellatus TaxID=259542 RepID=A0AAV4DKW6_9GAST|nr:hypothetical protein PoB_007133100 [Plakobranchus ocellatus]